MKKNLHVFFGVLMGISFIVIGCEADGRKKLELNIENDTPDELYVSCYPPYVTISGVTFVTIPSYSSKSMSFFYFDKYDTAGELRISVRATQYEGSSSTYSYRNKLTSTTYNIYIKKTKNPENLYKISVEE